MSSAIHRNIFLVIMIVLSNNCWAQYNVDSLKSIYDEQYPVLSIGGDEMYFTMANHPENVGGTRDKGDIWKSQLIDNRWMKPVKASKTINNKNWNAVLGFYNDGKSMLLHHHYADGKQGLSRSNRSGAGWSKPMSLKIPYFKNKSDIQSGSISNDGSIIVLSLESYSSKGVEDIYVLLMNRDGSWSDLKNIGNTINTRYQEISPYLAEDKKTLFFASNGHPDGYGSFDIYKSVRQDDSWNNWSTPVNLGSEINTEGKESSYVYLSDQEIAMYVSTQDSDGYGDIKFTKRKEEIDTVVQFLEAPVEVIIDTVDNDMTKVETLAVAKTTSPTFKGMIKDIKNSELIEAVISLSSIQGNLLKSVVAKLGLFDFEVEVGEYHLKVEAEGYISKLVTVVVDSIATNYEIQLAPIVVGETVNLKSVLFTQGTDELLVSSNEELDIVVNMMKNNPKMEILLGGHTDNRGSSKLNLALSEKRVKAVKKYLQSHGISGKRIDGKGYGGSSPIASNKNESTRKLNRRVEFTVTKN